MNRMKLKAFTFQIGSGTLIAQLISFAFLPIISTIYTPPEYGKFNFILSLSILALPLATLRMETSLLLEPNNDEVRRTFNLAIKSGLFFGTVTSPVIFLLLYKIKGLVFYDAIEFSIYFFLILISQILMVMLIQLNIRNSKYAQVGASGIVQNLVIGVSQVLLSKIKPSGGLLALGFILGKFFGVIPLLKSLKMLRISPHFQTSTQKNSIKQKIHQNKYLITSSLFDNATSTFPVLMVGTLFGLQYSGYVGLAQIILTVPITLVAGSIGSVVLGEFSQLNRKSLEPAQNIKLFFIHFFKPLVAAAIFFSVITILFGAQVFELVLGTRWSDSATLIQLIAIPLSINFMWLPFSSYLITEKKWKLLTIFASLRLIVGAAVVSVFLILNSDWIVAVLSFYVSGAVIQLVIMAGYGKREMKDF
jgi:O-antigen/teichoic acid export membrane protein